MASSTFRATYRDFEITIVGYEIPEGWRMAVELKRGNRVQVMRDTGRVFRDFASLRCVGVLTSHIAIMEETTGLE
ncbi:hypothetical protein Herbaro_11255 [Herbaspirillum sp. WKF16]|uniref:hypothetical protein n=1 Tax=Herbaspirillum sp. WKF16 TaxID=3028312 RepID=UPI0023A96621|nr:hypothetical protein [Herbaspirillum sp. WKF16]WDZ98336.1 hypothetical protein Herbaro_11255 [Herbaspirillum sp. WKF16]